MGLDVLLCDRPDMIAAFRLIMPFFGNGPDRTTGYAFSTEPLAEENAVFMAILVWSWLGRDLNSGHHRT
jgi:hypothetical protein